MADPNEKNIDEFKQAIKEAEEKGIKVLDVSTFNLIPLVIEPFKDKDDPNNYAVTSWMKNYESSMTSSDLFYVPTSGRTTAVGQSEDKDEYVYWTNGGLSWGIPYIEGVIALGLQVDPALDMEDAIKYLRESGYPFSKGKMINPEGFINLVQDNKKIDLNKDDYYFLYNSEKVSAEDLQAIKQYGLKFAGSYNVILNEGN